MSFFRLQALLLYQTYTCASLCYVALKFKRNKENVEVEDWWPSMILSFTFESISHDFRVPLCLCFKTSLSGKPFLWKWFWSAWKMNLHAELIFISKVSYLDSCLKQRHNRTRKWPTAYHKYRKSSIKFHPSHSILPLFPSKSSRNYNVTNSWHFVNNCFAKLRLYAWVWIRPGTSIVASQAHRTINENKPNKPKIVLRSQLFSTRFAHDLR